MAERTPRHNETYYLLMQQSGSRLAEIPVPIGHIEAGFAPARLPQSIINPAAQPHAGYDLLKRTIDLILAIVLLLVLLLPVLLITGLLILLSTREAPLLTQRRVGYLGREFTMLKLRTMHGDGLRRQPGDGVIALKQPDDARVTRVGAWLRRTSIDEIPQLLNVLAGQMSLVGPRPGLPEEVAAYPASWRRRLSVRPGLSGLWQVSGRSQLEPRRWMALDRLYIRRRSLLFDAAVLFRTVAAVVSMRGAW